MNTLKLKTVILTLLFFGFAFTACNDADTKNYEAEKEEVRLKINNSINKVDMKIAELEGKLERANEETSEEIRETLEELREKKAELREDLNDADRTMDAQWEEFKADVDASVNDVEDWLDGIDIDIDVDNDNNTNMNQ